MTEGHPVTVWFYVTVMDRPHPGGAVLGAARIGWLLGPYPTQDAAERKVPAAKRIAAARDDRADFYAYGVTRATAPAGQDPPPGLLNRFLDAEEGT